MTQFIPISTDTASVYVRILVNGEDDFPKAQAIQKSMKMTAVNTSGRTDRLPLLLTKEKEYSKYIQQHIVKLTAAGLNSSDLFSYRANANSIPLLYRAIGVASGKVLCRKIKLSIWHQLTTLMENF
ncbi:hypothetical protein [Agarivorans sp. B2Z047]|uniref:hypothetical protein n=1 Tax=Agarivorans sp. B2Z047 TaxID=2652721 RepID=UPI001883688F|nr:hypothetical protein [Agarivorans sp. B2Z047]UQN40966.1 DUF1254 domain-containing protein [Agarivorans sp. B2Z047]